MHTETHTNRVAGVEPLTPHGVPLPGSPPAHDMTPCDAFYRHFRRCFFCHFGDRYTSDYFCEEGRELAIAILDECHDRIAWT